MLVSKMREHLRPSSGVKYEPWTTLKRKRVYGWTEKQVRKQLVTVDFCGKHVAVHKKVAADLAEIAKRIRKWERLNGHESWKPKDVQSFCWRPIRGGKTLSRHAHAIAIDVDPAHNAYNGTTTDIPRHVIQIFINEGWCWGGQWHSPVDAMHFQKH